MVGESRSAFALTPPAAPASLSRGERGKLAPGARFDLAAPADDAELRRILRENPMAGPIRLSLEREPSFFAASAVEGGEHQTIVGRRPDGGVFGFGTRSVRTAYVNGEPVRLGYLSGLRLDKDHRGDGRSLARGYRLFRELHDADGRTPLYLTSILSGNEPARRFLEAGVRGMPTYRFVGELVTLVMPVRRPSEVFARPSTRARAARRRRGCRLKHGDASRLAEIAGLLAADGRRRQFSPMWIADDLGHPARTPGLCPADFRLAYAGDGRAVGCAALWDQRAFKQTVVRGYAPPLARLRPWLNAAARLTGRPPLPRVGERLNLAFVSHAAAAEDGAHTAGGPGASGEAIAAVVGSLVASLCARARSRRIDYLVIGFGAADPRLRAVRRQFGGREVRSRLYAVFWPDHPAGVAAAALDGRPIGPEVATL